MRRYIPPEFVDFPAEAECVFRGVIHDVYQWQQLQFDGSYATFEMLRRPDTVITIPVVNDKLMLSKEEQPHSGTFLNFPGGRHDNPAEDELQAAKRETREETGYTFNTWKLLVAYQPRGHFSYLTYIFIAYDVAEVGEQELDAGEKITPVFKTLQEYKEMKDSPLLRSYHDNVFDSIDLLEELFKLPSIYDYGS